MILNFVVLGAGLCEYDDHLIHPKWTNILLFNKGRQWLANTLIKTHSWSNQQCNSYPDHTNTSVRFRPWNHLGLCWEIDVGPPLFTLLQPEMPADGAIRSRYDLIPRSLIELKAPWGRACGPMHSPRVSTWACSLKCNQGHMWQGEDKRLLIQYYFRAPS
jgi:hypothetical protein